MVYNGAEVSAENPEAVADCDVAIVARAVGP